MNEPNVPLLRKMVEWVEEQDKLPELGPPRTWDRKLPPSTREWYQGSYRTVRDCGTLYCMAGKVCEDAGIQWAGSTTWGTLDGAYDSAEAHARRLFRISHDQGLMLFAAGNDAATMRALAEGFAGERL